MGKLSAKQIRAIAGLLVALAAAVFGAGNTPAGCSNLLDGASSSRVSADAPQATDLGELPAYDGSPYAVIDADNSHPDGTPSFTPDEISRAEAGSFESYSSLDRLGRCGVALACVGTETMPTGPRGDISEIHPSGWKQRFYDFVDQEALYNRCHLIARSLSAEDANARNLITGTRSMNTQGMLPFEEATVAYVERTGNHVLYRATPVFDGNELVARGVQLEARSVEDDGRGLSFNVYCYNVEPGVEIDYATGRNWEA